MVPPELADFLKNSSPAKSAPQPNVTSPTAAGRSRQVQDISFGDVRIENGTVRYRDERTGVAEAISQINARVAGKSLGAPVDLKGSLVLRGEKVDIDTRLTTPKAMIEQRPVRVALALSSAHGSARYDGTLSHDKSPQFEGALKLDTPSLRRLASWIGATLPDNGGLAAMSLKADVKTGPTWVALSQYRGQARRHHGDRHRQSRPRRRPADDQGEPAGLRRSTSTSICHPPPLPAPADGAGPQPARPSGGSPTIDDIIRQSGGASAEGRRTPGQRLRRPLGLERGAPRPRRRSVSSTPTSGWRWPASSGASSSSAPRNSRSACRTAH